MYVAAQPLASGAYLKRNGHGTEGQHQRVHHSGPGYANGGLTSPFGVRCQSSRSSLPSSGLPSSGASWQTVNTVSFEGSKRASSSTRPSFQTLRSKSTAVTATAAEGMGETTKVVEHIVYFKVKEDAPPEKVVAMVSALRGLASLEGVIQVNVGEAIKIPNVPSSGWTHALHGRYVNKDALSSYSASVEHVKVVNELVKPVIEDIMAVDWEVELTAPAADPGVGIVHSAAMKLKEGTTEEQIAAMVNGLRGHEGAIPGVRQVSIGPNFAPARAKGHDWGFVSYHGNIDDLRSYAKDPEHGKVMKELVFPLVEKSASVDFYVDVPPTSKI